MFYQQMLLESEKLKERIHNIEKELAKYPKEELLYHRNGNYTKWILKRDNNTQIYLKKSKKEIIEKLAIKKYYSSLLQDCLNEKKAVDSYLSIHDSYNLKVNSLLDTSSPYSEILSLHFKSFPQQIQEWINTPYKKNTLNPQDLIHDSLSHNRLRSKSEAMIDSLLYTYKIPYRYEALLLLDNREFYPDFTLLHPKTGELYYWEHFGLMTQETYARSSCNKLYAYSQHNIIPTINLITTFETQKNPLTLASIDKTIKDYFL